MDFLREWSKMNWLTLHRYFPLPYFSPRSGFYFLKRFY